MINKIIEYFENREFERMERQYNKDLKIVNENIERMKKEAKNMDKEEVYKLNEEEMEILDDITKDKYYG